MPIGTSALANAPSAGLIVSQKLLQKPLLAFPALGVTLLPVAVAAPDWWLVVP
jgi:hypothetical protein